MLIDKSPLHTIHAAFLRMLFPKAPILFMRRHPLDVCLSCFMQDFTMNSFMTHYTTPEGVARVYDVVMRSWVAMQDWLSPAPLVVRYEELVATPEPVLRRIVSHLGLRWDDRLLDHTGHARSRGLINTPSYEQVTQPINAKAVDRWRRYQDQLEETARIVAPWLREFEYDGPEPGGDA